MPFAFLANLRQLTILERASLLKRLVALSKRKILESGQSLVRCHTLTPRSVIWLRLATTAASSLMMKLISKKPLFRLQKHYWDQAYLSGR